MPFEFDHDPVTALPACIPGEAQARADRNGWAYSAALGAFIAQEYAEGTDGDRSGARDGGLWGLHAAMPDRVPPPGVVRAWCRQFPAFGTLMRQAEALRAERLMEETVVIADTAPGVPARVALQIAARVRLAESLDAPRWRAGGPGGNAPAMLPKAGEQPVALEVSDAELEALVLAQREPAAG